MSYNILPTIKKLDVFNISDKIYQKFKQEYELLTEIEEKYYYSLYLSAYCLYHNHFEYKLYLKHLLMDYIKFLKNKNPDDKFLEKLVEKVSNLDENLLQEYKEIILLLLDKNREKTFECRGVEDGRILLTKYSWSPFPYILLRITNDAEVHEKLKEYLRVFFSILNKNESEYYKLFYNKLKFDFYTRDDFIEIISDIVLFQENAEEYRKTIKSYADFENLLNKIKTLDIDDKFIGILSKEFYRYEIDTFDLPINSIYKMNYFLYNIDINNIREKNVLLRILYVIIESNDFISYPQLYYAILKMILMEAINARTDTSKWIEVIDKYLGIYLKMYENGKFDFYEKSFLIDENKQKNINFRLRISNYDIDYTKVHPLIIFFLVLFENLGGFPNYNNSVRRYDTDTNFKEDTIFNLLNNGKINENYFPTFFSAIIYILTYVHDSKLDIYILSKMFAVILEIEQELIKKIARIMQHRKSIQIPLANILAGMIYYSTFQNIKLIFDIFEAEFVIKDTVKNKYCEQKNAIINLNLSLEKERDRIVNQLNNFLKINANRKLFESIISFLTPIYEWLSSYEADLTVTLYISKYKIIDERNQILYTIIRNNTKYQIQLFVSENSVKNEIFKIINNLKLEPYSEKTLKLKITYNELSSANLMFSKYIGGRLSSRRSKVIITPSDFHQIPKVKQLYNKNQILQSTYYFPNINGEPFQKFTDSSFLLRKNLEKEVDNFLSTNTASPFIVIGIRRIGKTSMFNYIWNKYNDLSNYFLLDASDNNITTMKRFMKRFLNKLQNKFSHNFHLLENRFNDEDLYIDDFMNGLSDFIEFMKNNNKNRLLIFMDEIENLFSNDSLYNDFFELLKKIYNNRNYQFSKFISFLIFGSNRIKKYFMPTNGMDTKTATWFMSCKQIEIRPINKIDDVFQMAIEPFKTSIPNLKIEEGILKKIIEVTSGFPYLIHNMGYELLEEIRNEEIVTITEYDIIKAEESMKEKKEIFKLLFEEIDFNKIDKESEKLRYLLYQLIIFILKKYYYSKFPITEEFIYNELQTFKIDRILQKFDLKDIIDELLNYKLIVKNEEFGYKLSGHLLYQFVSEYLQLESLKDAINKFIPKKRNSDEGMLDWLNSVENKNIEFKSTLFYDLNKYLETNIKEKNIEVLKSSLKTIIGFLNRNSNVEEEKSYLIVGITEVEGSKDIIKYNKHNIFGLEYKMFTDIYNMDKYKQWAISMLEKHIPKYILDECVNIEVLEIDDRMLLKIEVSPYRKRLILKQYIDDKNISWMTFIRRDGKTEGVKIISGNYNNLSENIQKFLDMLMVMQDKEWEVVEMQI